MTDEHKGLDEDLKSLLPSELHDIMEWLDEDEKLWVVGVFRKESPEEQERLIEGLKNRFEKARMLNAQFALVGLSKEIKRLSQVLSNRRLSYEEKEGAIHRTEMLKKAKHAPIRHGPGRPGLDKELIRSFTIEYSERLTTIQTIQRRHTEMVENGLDSKEALGLLTLKYRWPTREKLLDSIQQTPSVFVIEYMEGRHNIRASTLRKKIRPTKL